MSDRLFYNLQNTLRDIIAGDCEMTFEDFESHVEELYDEGRITGTQYDWLIANI